MGPVDPRLLRRSRPVRVLLVAATGLGAATVAALLVQSWALSLVVRETFDLAEGASSSTDAVLGAGAVAGLALALRGLVGWIQSVVAARAAARVVADLRHDLVDALVDPRRVGVAPHRARFVALTDQGLERVQPYVGRFLPQVALTALAPAGVIVTLAVVDPWSALVVLLTVPLVVVFLVLVGLMTRDRLDQRWAELARLGHHFAEVLDGLRVLSGFGRDSERAVRETAERHRRATMSSLRIAFLSALVLELFSTLSVAIVAVTVGLRVVGGGLELQPALFVLLAAPEAFLPLRRLGAQFHDSIDGAEAAREAMDLLEVGRSSGAEAVPDWSRIELRDVVVAGPGRTREMLRCEQLTIHAGRLTAVTGPSGAGKSTLVAVLLGLVAPDEGTVTVGGVDLATLDVQEWRRGVAWVPQVPAVVSGVVRDVVTQGLPADDSAVLDPAATEVARALELAGAEDLLPERAVGELGTGLSTGERRRLAVARALLRVRRGARLVLLDEPTAGLDQQREQRVLDSLRRSVGPDVAVVVVAHRTEAVHVADDELRLEVTP